MTLRLELRRLPYWGLCISQEVQRRAADKAQIDARLQGQSKIAEVEHELRRVELDAQERLRLMQMQAELNRPAEPTDELLQASGTLSLSFVVQR